MYNSEGSILYIIKEWWIEVHSCQFLSSGLLLAWWDEWSFWRVNWHLLTGGHSHCATTLPLISWWQLLGSVAALLLHAPELHKCWTATIRKCEGQGHYNLRECPPVGMHWLTSPGWPFILAAIPRMTGVTSNPSPLENVGRRTHHP